MTTDICSIWAYQEIKESGYIADRQCMYLSVFVDAHPEAMTSKEADQKVSEKFGVNKIIRFDGRRLSELLKMGFLEKTRDKFRCKITGKTVNGWVYTGRKTPLPTRRTKCQCPRCDGKGFVLDEEYYHPLEQPDLFKGGHHEQTTH